MKKNFLKTAGLLGLVAVSSTATLASCNTGPIVGVTYWTVSDETMQSSWQPMYQYLVPQKGWTYSQVDGQNAQLRIEQGVQDFINQGAVGLLINLVESKSGGSVINTAKSADVPIVLYNKEPTKGDAGEADKDSLNAFSRAYFVGTVAQEAGDMQAQMAFDWLKEHKNNWDRGGDDKLKMFIIKGEDGHAEAEARTKGCYETLVKLLNQTGHGIVKKDGSELTGADVLKEEKTAKSTAGTGSWDKTAAQQIFDDIIAPKESSTDAFDLIFSNNDSMAVGVIGSSKFPDAKSDKVLPIWGVDATSDGLGELKKGTLTGTILNDIVNQALVAVDLLEQLTKVETTDTEGIKTAVKSIADKYKDVATFDEAGKAFRIKYVPITNENIDKVQNGKQWVAAQESK